MRPIVLGIDPGLRCSGYALLQRDPAAAGPAATLLEAGVIRLDPALPLEARLADLAGTLAELLDQRRPHALTCEELYAHYKHPRTAILMAHARGVILCAAAQRDIPVLNVSARQVKKLLTGSGRAGKAQMQQAAAATFGLSRLPQPHDVADAMAIGLCGLYLLNAGACRERPSARSARNGTPA